MLLLNLIVSFLLCCALAQKEKPPFKIVHLGDSFSAGNGARSPSGVKSYFSVRGCYRSPYNWGSRFAASLTDVFSVTYINRACSGAVLQDITKQRDVSSVGIRGRCPKPKYPDEEVYTKLTSRLCRRSLKPQIIAVDKTVDLVILTIGGNDAKFDEIVKSCFSLFRTAEDCSEAIDFADSTLSAFTPKLAATLRQIYSRMKKNGRVALVSYPHIILDTYYGLSLSDGSEFYITRPMRELSKKADRIQQAAISQVNSGSSTNFAVYFSRSKQVFDSHEPDPSAIRKNPDRWINEFFDPAFDMAEWYHPNRIGHENWGKALSALDTLGAVGGGFTRGGNIDLVFVVDTTGSMRRAIIEARRNMRSLVNQLSSATSSFRVAIVSYRDFPSRTSSINYPSRVDQSFTNNLASIQKGIDSLTADGGGDFAETVLSGINTAINLPWRAGVTKVTIVIGDAPPLLEIGAEPISGLTPAQVIADSIAVDPVQVFAVNLGRLLTPSLQSIVDGTGGRSIVGTTGLVSVLSDIINTTSKQPFAWFGTSVVGKIGESVEFNAQGSYDPQGNAIQLYEWDFDGDGTFDRNTTNEKTQYTYSKEFEGFVILRVTSKGGSALASARTVVNTEGSVKMVEDEPCELDEDGFSKYLTDEGIVNTSCTATKWPTKDRPGVIEILSNETSTAAPSPSQSPSNSATPTPTPSFKPSNVPSTITPSTRPRDDVEKAIDELDRAVRNLTLVFRVMAWRIRNMYKFKKRYVACHLVIQLKMITFQFWCRHLPKEKCETIGKRITNGELANVISAARNIEKALKCSPL